MNSKTTKDKFTIDKGLKNLVINELLNLEASLTKKLVEVLESHTEGATYELKEAIYDVLYYELNHNFEDEFEIWELKHAQETEGTNKGGKTNVPNQSQTKPQINKTTNN